MPTLPSISSLLAPFRLKPKPTATSTPLFGSLFTPAPQFKSFGTPAPTATTALPATPIFPTPTGAPITPAKPIPAPTFSTQPVPQVQNDRNAQIETIRQKALGIQGQLTDLGPPATPELSGGESPTPKAPIVSPETTKAVTEAERVYQESLKLSPETLSTQEDLDKLVESTRSAFRGIEDKPIPLAFITGQLQSVEKRALGLAEPLERKLARLQSTRTSALEASKFALDRADKKVAAERDATKPIAGSSFYDPTTGTFKQAPEKAKAAESFTLNEGDVRYDAQGNVIARGAPKTKAPSEASIKKAFERDEKAVAAQQAASQSIGLVNNLLSGNRYKKISGALQSGSVPFLGDRSAVNEYDQLQGLLKLEARQLIKGTGSVSDYEGKVLGQAASALSRLTNEKQMGEALRTVRGVLKTNAGESTEVIVKDKNGKIVGQGILNGQDIYDAVNDGNTIQYL